MTMTVRRLLTVVTLLLSASSSFATTENEPISYPQEAFGFVVLNVTDVEKSAEFYRTVVGLSEHLRYTEGKVTYILLDVPGSTSFPRLALAQDKARKEPYVMGDAYSRCAFFVPDLALILKRAAKASVQVLSRADEKSIRLKVASLKDPDGYSVELLQSY